MRASRSDGDEGVRVLIARHPETEANREHRYISETDSPYSPLGRSQAAELARCIAEFAPDAVLASPARRAAVPATEAARMTGAALRLDDDLREVGWGRAEGLTYAEVRAASIPMDYLGGPTAGEVAGGGERWESFTARVGRAARGVEGSGRRVAVVTHGGVVRALLVHWLSLPPEAAWRFAIPPACVARVRIASGYGTLEAFGLTPRECAGRERRD